MRVVAYDPYVSPQSARDIGVELKPLSELFELSDYITLHVSLTPETEHMLNAEAFAKMKPGARIVNCARGELIDVDALQDALKSGKIAGAGLDVFEQEPPGELPLFGLDSIVATPHIAGSTEEAQEIVGIRIAEQVAEYLKSGVALNAVNMPALTAEQYKALGPFVDLAERLGQFLSHIAEGNIHTIRIIYSGRLADSNTQILRNASLAGVLSRSVEYRVNLVNAMPLATERGFRIVEQREPTLGGMDSIRMELETADGKFLGRWRAGAEQAQAAAGGEHFVRGDAGRQPHVLEERRRAGCHRLPRVFAGRERNQHRELRAWPAGSGRCGRHE